MVQGDIAPGQAPVDTADFFRLFVASGPEYIPALFAGWHERFATGCFGRRGNVLSSEHTLFVKVDGRNAGMVLAYDWRTKKRQAIKSSFLTIWYMRLGFLLRLGPLRWSDTVLSKVEDGTFYISNIAVYSEFRNRGLGARLLTLVEEKAGESGAARLDVDAETDNTGAIRFYEAFGMRAEGKPKRTVVAGKHFEFVRLTKEVFPVA